MITYQNLKCSLTIAVLGTSLTAQAQMSMTGFATIGFAASDKSYAYQRFVDRQGTFDRDSILGLQLDSRLSDQFSFVIQGKVAPSIKNDNSWDPTLTWAFLSWRPTNDLLLRLGKVRIPYYLNSANIDVGVTYEPAQLPPELYSISTTNETDGISFSKNWALAGGELTADGYWGNSNSYWRFFFRDGLNYINFSAQTPRFMPTRIDSKGLALTFIQNDNIFRIGMHQADVRRRDGDLFTPNLRFVPLSPTQGVYVVDTPSLLDRMRFNIFTLGADIALGNDYRLSGEYVRRINVSAPSGGADTHGGYLSLQRKIGPWNPYVSIAKLISTDPSIDQYQAANANRVSFGVPPLTVQEVNASQRLNADRLIVYDQSTIAIGTSYTLSPTQKIKAEWAMTHVGKVSSFVDAPEGADIARQNINVLSCSYNFIF